LIIKNIINYLNINKYLFFLKLLQRIRDEAHRFAISYNKLLRKKAIK
jgi:excinuclease UvrABC nuclease subunit